MAENEQGVIGVKTGEKSEVERGRGVLKKE